MTEHANPADMRSALRAAAIATAARLAPGHGVPLARHLALLSETEPPPAPRVWTDADAVVLSAYFAARARRDALADGAELLDRYFDNVRLARPATMSSGARSQLYASVGEYSNAIGWPQMGARYGTEALLFADTAGLRYRALSVAALGHALNGEYPSAEAELRDARDLFVANAWPVTETAYVELLARALVASARLDVDALLETARRMSEAQPDDPYASYSSRAIEVMAMMFRGDHGVTRAASRQLLTGGDHHSSHRMIRYFVVGALSEVMVAQGDSEEALAVLSPYESPEGHGICFAMQRSAALLRLGRERELLVATEACVASETDHCLRSLTPLLVRRALALNRIGHPRRARDAMAAALLLIARTGLSATPFLMLPLGETRDLVDAATADHPELAPTLTAFQSAVARVALPDSPHRAPAPAVRFTPTERTLLELLTTPLSLAEIAEERGVSRNTIKSQVRSICLKLGVRGRAEAIALLAEIDARER